MLIEVLCVLLFGDTKRMRKSDVDDNGNMPLLMKLTPQPFLLSKVYQLIFPSIEGRFNEHYSILIPVLVDGFFYQAKCPER